MNTMNTDSVNNPAGYLERRQKRMDNITRLAVAFLSNPHYKDLTPKQIVNRAAEIYDAIDQGPSL